MRLKLRGNHEVLFRKLLDELQSFVVRPKHGDASSCSLRRPFFDRTIHLLVLLEMQVTTSVCTGFSHGNGFWLPILATANAHLAHLPLRFWVSLTHSIFTASSK